MPDVPDGATDWERLAALTPDAARALAGLVGAAWDDVDPALMELARLRVATLLRYPAELERRSARARDAGVTDAKLAALASWPSSPLFTDRERACLELTEQFVMDANGVTPEHVRTVVQHLGSAGCYAFVEAVSVLETFQRACLTLGIDSTPGVDELTAWGSGPSSSREVAP